MAIEGALQDDTSEQGLFVGADHTVEMVVYTSSAKTTVKDITGWTIRLDIRKTDTSSAALYAEDGTISGTFNSSPGTNTQKVSWSLSDDELAATIFTGDDWTGRYSVKRTDAGSEQPLRFGAVTITRVTQT